MKRSIPFIVAASVLGFMGCFRGTTRPETSPDRFLLHYVCDTGDEINTFEGYIVKDSQANGVKRAGFRITQSDSARIWAKLEEIHLFEMKSPYPSRPWVGDKPVTWPNKLRVAFGDTEKYIEWDDIRGDRSPDKEPHELRDFLLNMIMNTTEWKALPPVRGYDL